MAPALIDTFDELYRTVPYCRPWPGLRAPQSDDLGALCPFWPPAAVPLRTLSPAVQSLVLQASLAQTVRTDAGCYAAVRRCTLLHSVRYCPFGHKSRAAPTYTGLTLPNTVRPPITDSSWTTDDKRRRTTTDGKYNMATFRRHEPAPRFPCGSVLQTCTEVVDLHYLWLNILNCR